MVQIYTEDIIACDSSTDITVHHLYSSGAYIIRQLKKHGPRWQQKYWDHEYFSCLYGYAPENFSCLFFSENDTFCQIHVHSHERQKYLKICFFFPWTYLSSNNSPLITFILWILQQFNFIWTNFFYFIVFISQLIYFFEKLFLIYTQFFLIWFHLYFFVITGLQYGLKVCCGASGQGQYNYNNNARCGMSGSSPCPDPQNYLIWDGIHLTEAAYRSIADGWLKGPYCSPAILG
jgi:hypothetical protein